MDDVDATYEQLKPGVTDFVNTPTTMPWGNRSLLLRDPDGNLINLFTPVPEQAIAKFGVSDKRETRRTTHTSVAIAPKPSAPISPNVSSGLNPR